MDPWNMSGGQQYNTVVQTVPTNIGGTIYNVGYNASGGVVSAVTPDGSQAINTKTGETFTPANLMGGLGGFFSNVMDSPIPLAAAGFLGAGALGAGASTAAPALTGYDAAMADLAASAPPAFAAPEVASIAAPAMTAGSGLGASTGAGGLGLSAGTAGSSIGAGIGSDIGAGLGASTGTGLTSTGGGLGLTSGGGLGLTAGNGASILGGGLGTDLATAGGLGASAFGAGGVGSELASLGSGSMLSPAVQGLTDSAAKGGLLSALKGSTLGAIGSGLLNLGAGYLQNQTNADAAQKVADAQIKAAQIAADAAKFRPVGVTTNFGSSKFGYDANGNLVSAGYTLNPALQSQQDQMMGALPGMLGQFTGSQQAVSPLQQAAQSAMGLGNQYLATSPQAQAQKYMANQNALLAAGNASQLANIRNNLAATGRQGLMVGGDAGMMASNPELQAYYNALNTQQMQLAANADQAGQQYAQFGANLAGAGGNMLNNSYLTQANSIQPYNAGLQMANTIEGLGQGALDLGTSIGAKTSTANANAGLLTGRGMIGAAQTMQPTNEFSLGANAMSGAGSALGKYVFGG